MSTSALVLTNGEAEVVFHGVSFHPTQRTTRGFGREDLDRELADPEVFSWIDLEGPSISALNDVLRRWDIDMRMVSQFDAPEVLPRIVERGDCLAFYLYEVADPESHLSTSSGLTEITSERMILVLGADFVITYHRRPMEVVTEVKATSESAFKLVGKTPGFIAFLFLERCLYDYAHLNLANDNALDFLQAKVRAGDYAGLTEAISIAGANILTLKKLASSIHIVLMLLGTKVSPFISPQSRASFNEMEHSASAVRGAIDSSRNLLDGIVAAVQAAAAARTNEIARVLTVMSGIMLPLSLVAGIYGMNFQKMPELAWSWGYYGALGFMAMLGVGLLLVFRRLGWVGKSGPGAAS